MSYTLTYMISPFVGSRGLVTEVAPTSLSIDASQHQPPENTVSANGPTGISVSKTGTGVVLNIKIRDSNRADYYPVGLAVQPQTGGSRTPGGVFPTANVSSSDNTVIVLTDLAQLPVAPGTYEFVVLFQAVNGNFGWLDPMITNDGP